MRKVSKVDALKDLSRFMRDMYCWCDQNGSYTTKMVSVNRDTLKALRRCVDAVIEAENTGAEIRIMDGYDSVYAQLCDSKRRRQDGR